MHQVLTTRDATGPNPDFDHRKHQEAVKTGENYDVPHSIEIPAGTHLTGPQAHYLCRPGYKNADPLAVPICEHTKTRVQRYYKTQREAGMRLLSSVVAVLPTDEKAVAHILSLAEKYHVTPDSKAKLEILKKMMDERHGSKKKK